MSAVKSLVEKGADIETKDYDTGFNAMHYSSMKGNWKLDVFGREIQKFTKQNELD